LSAITRSPEPFEVGAPDGARLAAVRIDGVHPPVLAAVHATGFCKELWEPVFEHLPLHRAIALDQRGHGDSSPIEAPFDWWTLGRDVLTVLGKDGGIVAVGHSSGAAALVLAELLAPNTFSGLVLIEPIIFPGPFFRAEENPMSARALRRRAAFPSPQAAYESYRGRGPFAGWDEAVLRRYVAHAFRAGPDGWTLKCTPDQEAEFYRGATLHGAWDRLAEVHCPVVIVGGSDSDSHPPSFLDAQAARFPDASVRLVEGATHFAPMERPEATAQVVRQTLARWG